MKKTNTELTCLLAALALAMAAPASAQTSTGAPAEPAGVDSGPGLVGTNYSELTFGYQRQQGEPSDIRDYEFLSNGNVYKNGSLGADANFTFDYWDAAAAGFADHREEAQMGLTGFLMETWGKPFLTADAGMAWQRADDVSRKSFAYTGIGGIEFQVLRNLALTPFVEYQAEPHLYNHEWPVANMYNHLVDYGVKATYRFTQQWSASVTGDLDQHSADDWGLRGGVSYRF
ncbi:MAG TPA: hypothetical protein VGG34_04600 [Opitutaceae bacterium]|jgi:hypothetical protein